MNFNEDFQITWLANCDEGFHGECCFFREKKSARGSLISVVEYTIIITIIVHFITFIISKYLRAIPLKNGEGSFCFRKSSLKINIYVEKCSQEGFQQGGFQLPVPPYFLMEYP